MSTKLETLLDFDTKVLGDVGVFDNDGGGMLSYTGRDGKPKAVTISGKRLVLPTQQFLRDGDWEKRIAWHPLSEQINEGPSPVLNATKNYITERLKLTFRELALALMELAAEEKRHKALTAKAGKYLVTLPGADQKVVDTLRKVLDSVGDAPEKRSITMFLKNGGKNGALRSCMVSFPILDESETEVEDGATFFGVKMPRKTKDKQLILSLFEYILGDKDYRETYTQSSSNSDAPYLHCLLLSFQVLAERFNKLIEVHVAACPQLSGFKFGLGWLENMNDFDNFAKVYGVAVPSLPGNSGVTASEPEDSSKDVFEADAEDLGKVAIDLPWDERPGDTGRRDSPSRDRRSVEREPVRQEGVPTRSLKDVLGGSRRNDEPDRETRGSSWRSSGRDDRGGGGRPSGRGGRSW